MVIWISDYIALYYEYLICIHIKLSINDSTLIFNWLYIVMSSSRNLRRKALVFKNYFQLLSWYVGSSEIKAENDEIKENEETYYSVNTKISLNYYSN